MRVAELNTTNSRQQCPEIAVRCAALTVDSCPSVFFSTQKINYTNVCGRITAYQVGTTNAFGGKFDPTIESATLTMWMVLVSRMDPVQFNTSGHLQLLWIKPALLIHKAVTVLVKNTTLASTAPTFIGNDYFCDAGNEEFMIGETGLHTNPLWDGTDCLCCDNPPWFYKQLPQPTTDDIEMRVRKDEGETNENIAIAVVNIYIR